MQKAFKFVEAVHVDRKSGERWRVEAGMAFTATMAEETAIDRRDPNNPRPVKTGRTVVVDSDIDVLPGCLTSCIRVGMAKDVPAEEKQQKTAKK